MEQSDEELVRHAQRRDPEAFGALVSRYERRALAIAFAVLSDSDAAGDAAQEAFVRAWQRLAELRERERFGPWLACIVRNVARDAARRLRCESRARAVLPSGRETSEGADPAQEFARKESSQRVAMALAELDENSRAVVVLRYYENLTSREIGDLLDLAPSAVDMRLSRARAELRRKLIEET